MLSPGQMLFVDPLLAIATLFPMLLGAAGIGFICYSCHDRTPADVEADVLAALSEREALPIALICRRPPLAGQAVDPNVVHLTLEHLRRTRRAVRWYEAEQQAIYRRVT
jgi:hypothetical protein